MPRGQIHINLPPWASHNVFRNNRNQNGRRICKKVSCARKCFLVSLVLLSSGSNFHIHNQVSRGAKTSKATFGDFVHSRLNSLGELFHAVCRSKALWVNSDVHVATCSPDRICVDFCGFLWDQVSRYHQQPTLSQKKKKKKNRKRKNYVILSRF